jgi:broad specificity phosphatase PhoE
VDDRRPTLTVVRHGSTEWSSAGRHTGRTDLSLSDEGLAAARRVGAFLSRYEFALVLTSPLARARETAGAAGFPDAVVDEDLREWDYGDYEGRTTADIRAERPGWLLWTDGAPGGETAEVVARRADRVVARCRRAGGDVLAFAHGHILRVVAARWLDEDPRLGGHLRLDPATVSVLGWEREVPVIAAWNRPPD